MGLPEKVEDIEVSSALIRLRKENKKDLEFRRKKALDRSNGGYFGFLYAKKRKDNLIRALRSGEDFKSIKSAYYEHEIAPAKKDFDRFLKLYLKTFSPTSQYKDDELVEKFEVCVAVIGWKDAEKNKTEQKRIKSADSDSKIKFWGFVLVILPLGFALSQCELEPFDECGAPETNPYYSTCKSNRMLEDMGSRYRVPAQ